MKEGGASFSAGRARGSGSEELARFQRRAEGPRHSSRGQSEATPSGRRKNPPLALEGQPEDGPSPKGNSYTESVRLIYPRALWLALLGRENYLRRIPGASLRSAPVYYGSGLRPARKCLPNWKHVPIPSPYQSNRGFSLIEVLVAILILGIGMVGLTHGLTSALSSSKESEEQTTAALLAAARIEQVRADGFLTEGNEEGDGEEGLSRFHWQQTISRTDMDGLYDVKVVVQKAKSGHDVYELETLLFDPPVSLSNQGTSTRQDNRDDTRRKNRRRQ